MNKVEVIEKLRVLKLKYLIKRGSSFDIALDMAIEALKAQDRPIICPRCGRTFSEAEGRSEDE